MRSNVINFVERAYKCSNPQESLKSVPVDKEMLDLILPKDLSPQFPLVLYNDLLAVRESRASSEAALQCQFIYFATSMVIIWENASTRLIDDLAQNMVDIALHSPRKPSKFSSVGMVAYVVPNVPIPFAWINVSSDNATVQLCHFGGPNFPTKFRVMLHVVRAVGQPIDLVKIAFDTSQFHRDPIVFSQGSAVQLALRLDTPEPRAEFSRPNPDFDCVVYVTMDMRQGSVYHRGKERLIHSFI